MAGGPAVAARRRNQGRDLPWRCGPWKTACDRFWHWSRNGTLTALVAQVQVVAEAIDELDREVSVDSSIVHAHQHAAGARHTGTASLGARQPRDGHTEPDDHALGRYLGGLSTKSHLVCDGHGRPLSVVPATPALSGR
ncbi:hypothetical protein GCM10010452_00490 [Crossiella cryophila]|uniref:Transposase n=1 Tax=Crossiella cryophila TaxID=43355 RepID=A0A7W7FWM1_9PSEU|nr:transposase [Crossiella cryophila]